MEKNKLAQVEITVNDSTRKAAFAEGINRDVISINVHKILEQIKLKGYRKAETIQVIPAEAAIKDGDITLIDIYGVKIAKEKASEYYLVVDGQHRVYAVAMLNKETREEIRVPAIQIELCNDECLAEYIGSINVTKTEWKTEDYVQSAANVTGNHLLKRFNELIKKSDRPDGISLTTLNYYYCGSPKSITKRDFMKLCQCLNKKDGRAKKNSTIPDDFNIERGDKLIKTLSSVGFTKKDIAKRYLGQIFHSIKTKTGWGDDDMLRLFVSITPNDCKAMHDKSDKLMESMVQEQFEIILKRFDKDRDSDSAIPDKDSVMSDDDSATQSNAVLQSEEPLQSEAETSTVDDTVDDEDFSSMDLCSQPEPNSEEMDVQSESGALIKTDDNHFRQAV